MINDTKCMQTIAEIEDTIIYNYLMSLYDTEITEIKYNHGVSYLRGREQQSNYLDRDVYISYRVLSIFDIHRQCLLLSIKSQLPISTIIYIYRMILSYNIGIMYGDVAHLRLTYNQDHRPISTIIFDSIPIKDMERRNKYDDIKI